MNIFLVYGTNSGGTSLVAETVASQLRAKGHQVSLKHAKDVQPTELSDDFDAVILGSCTWERYTSSGERLEGQLQQHMFELLEHSNVPSQRRFALFALGDSSYTDFCAAADHLEAAVRKWSGTLIVPSLRLDSYYFNLRKNRTVVVEWSKKLTEKLYE